MTYQERLNKTSDIIKDAEAKLMAHHCFVEARYENLIWGKYGFQWRIGIDGKPLIECQVETKLKLIKNVPKLVKSAMSAMDLALLDAGL